MQNRKKFLRGYRPLPRPSLSGEGKGTAPPTPHLPRRLRRLDSRAVTHDLGALGASVLALEGAEVVRDGARIEAP